MKKITILIFLFALLSLHAISIQEANDCAEQAARNLQQTVLERTDFNMLFFQYLPYTIGMYNVAKELQYTNTVEYRWNPVNSEYQQVSSATVTYSRGVPLVYTMTMTVQEQTITMEYTYEHQDQMLVGMSSTITMMEQTMDNTREFYTWEDGHIVSMLMEVNVITDWMEEERATISWSGDNLTQIVYESIIDDVWENTTRETVQYDGSNPTYWLEEEWEWGTTQWIDFQQEDYTYSGGYMTECLYQIYHEGAWNNEELTYYTWDGGVPTGTLEKNWDGTAWYDAYQSTYNYDEHNNIVEVYSDEWVDGRSWEPAIKLTYGYGAAVDDGDVPVVETRVSVYPNPFNPTTNIAFTLASDSHVTLDIYNIRGQKVETLFNGHKEMGAHTITWEAKVSSGVYFAVMNTGGEQIVRKMVLMK